MHGEGNQPLNIKTAVERPILKLGLPNCRWSFYSILLLVASFLFKRIFMTSYMLLSIASQCKYLRQMDKPTKYSNKIIFLFCLLLLSRYNYKPILSLYLLICLLSLSNHNLLTKCLQYSCFTNLLYFLNISSTLPFFSITYLFILMNFV